jgi:hypothetical protein
MGDVLIITPVRPGQVQSLRAHLNALPRDTPPGEASGGAPTGGPGQPPSAVPRSPFTGVLPPTHFARFAVIELYQRPQLLFSSRFDGTVAEYLRALAATAEAQVIWSHCQVTEDGAAPDQGQLEGHLCDPRHQFPSQYVVGAFPAQLTVGEINASLTLRAQLSRFATLAAGLDQWALAHEFRQLPAIRQLLSR